MFLKGFRFGQIALKHLTAPVYFFSKWANMGDWGFAGESYSAILKISPDPYIISKLRGKFYKEKISIEVYPNSLQNIFCPWVNILQIDCSLAPEEFL